MGESGRLYACLLGMEKEGQGHAYFKAVIILGAFVGIAAYEILQEKIGQGFVDFASVGRWDWFRGHGDCTQVGGFVRLRYSLRCRR